MLAKRRLFIIIKENFTYSSLKWYSSEKLPLIVCKNPKYNYRGEGVSRNKKGSIVLASDGWHHKKSSGDYFTVNPKVSEVSKPNNTFADFSFAPEILSVLSERGLTVPSRIQRKAFSTVLSGKNSIIAAETGCGKTLAFLLPILQQIVQKGVQHENLNAPSAVIIAPNRELANQTAEVAAPFCNRLNLKLECLTGGHMKRVISHADFKEINLVVASFGALSKMVTHQVYKLNNVRHVVLDEADTLLDDSFNEKVCHFLKKIPFRYNSLDLNIGSQLTLVSATMPMYLSDLLSTIVDVDSIERITTEDLHKILPTAKQLFLRLRKSEKAIQLLKIVRREANKKHPLLIFANDSPTCNWISLFLNENGIKSASFHSKMPMEARSEIFAKFKKGEYGVIVCTDIGSRGLDTTKVKHVLNYDFPQHTADYIHRCGRTGRLGSSEKCMVTNFVATQYEVATVQKIESSIRQLKVLPKVNGNITRLMYGDSVTADRLALPVIA